MTFPLPTMARLGVLDITPTEHRLLLAVAMASIAVDQQSTGDRLPRALAIASPGVPLELLAIAGESLRQRGLLRVAHDGGASLLDADLALVHDIENWGDLEQFTVYVRGLG